MSSRNARLPYFLAGALATAALFLAGAAPTSVGSPRYDVEIDDRDPIGLRITITDHKEQKLFWYGSTMKDGKPKTTKLLTTVDLTSVGKASLEFSHEVSSDAKPAPSKPLTVPVPVDD